MQLVANSRSASDDLTDNDSPSQQQEEQLERRQREQQVMAGDLKWQNRAAGETTIFIEEGDELFNRASVEHRPSAEQIRQVQNSYERERESRQMMADDSPNRQIFNAHSYRTSPQLADKREQPYPPVPVQPIDPSRAGANCFIL